MSFTRLNAYHIMQLIVMFDLPVKTKQQRKQAADFRKGLESCGFTMLQYSVYVRVCASHEAMAMHIRRVRALVPGEGHIRILSITDKQFSNMINIYGAIEKKSRPIPLQLEFF